MFLLWRRGVLCCLNYQVGTTHCTSHEQKSRNHFLFPPRLVVTANNSKNWRTWWSSTTSVNLRALRLNWSIRVWVTSTWASPKIIDACLCQLNVLIDIKGKLGARVSSLQTRPDYCYCSHTASKWWEWAWAPSGGGTVFSIDWILEYLLLEALIIVTGGTSTNKTTTDIAGYSILLKYYLKCLARYFWIDMKLHLLQLCT